MTELSEESQVMREERKAVTALDADIVGSTALAERLDAEEAKLILGEAITRMIAAVEELGGTVKDLAGDGVLALFGAPVAHEDDAERAVRAGLRIAEELAAYGSEVAAGWGVEDFAVRVGVNTGSVVLGPVGAGSRVEYGAVGDAINTAARLQSAATPGSVLVGESTHRLVQPLFDWDGPRRLTLKGKEGEVVAYEVTGVSAVPGRTRGLLGVQTPLVGRDAELAVARDAAEAVLAGTGGILFITGEAGIGKSRLAAELRAFVEAADSTHGAPRWLEGRCVSYGESLPYWPYRDILRDWLGVALREPELRLRVALRREVDRLFGERALEIYPYLGAMLGLTLEPEAGARLAELSPEALQYRTFEVVRALFERLADERPLVIAVDDLHWADATSLQLTEQLLGATDSAAVLLVLEQRPERDHASWRVKAVAAEHYAHRSRELALETLSGEAHRQLLHSIVGAETIPIELEDHILESAEGNPFYLEELIAALVETGVLVRSGESWRFDHEAEIEIPPTVEKLILARIDRLPESQRRVLTAASVLGRHFGLPLLKGVTDEDGSLGEALNALQRVDLIREARRWPEPEYRFKHALIQETAYRTLLAATRKELHGKAVEWLEAQFADSEDEVLGLLAHHALAAEDEEKAVRYLTRAGDRARLEWALDEAIGHYRALLPLLERRGADREIALVLFKLAIALHTSLRFADANTAYQRAFEHWQPLSPGTPGATVRMAGSYVPRVADPRDAGFWPDINLCMQLFDRLVEAWPERTIVPSLAERWEISDDGLRYLFHLREGLRWSDGEPLTAHDVEFGVKRMLNPKRPAITAPIYFVLENGEDYYLGRNDDADRIGVRALDDRTVEFRLVAPTPYFMNLVNRPDGGPQPRHAIERDGDAWSEPDKQVVSGPFRQLERSNERLVLVRNDAYTGIHTGNVERVELTAATADEALEPLDRGEVDLVRVMYTPRTSDHVRSREGGSGPLTWTAYLAFNHSHPVVGNVDLRRALASAVARSQLEPLMPANLEVATGGLVPPALQGHTPDIVLPFDANTCRDLFGQAGVDASGLEIAAQDVWAPLLEAITGSWREVLGLDVGLRLWTAETVDEVARTGRPLELAPIAVLGWLPGYPDPEYCLRLILHSHANANEGRYAFAPFDKLIDEARQAPTGAKRLELFRQADRLAVVDQAAVIPLVYGRSMAFVRPGVEGWWEFAKSSASFADLEVS
ncbi:MAG TPA: ABC transporter substrate-binding protein [Gaiellaceae bacterium]|nr:ABC transporter substrate-binding protein [Gaiellaceae bacterium]